MLCSHHFDTCLLCVSILPLDYWMAVWQREHLRLLWSDPGVYSRSVAAETRGHKPPGYHVFLLLKPSCTLAFFYVSLWLWLRDCLHLVYTESFHQVCLALKFLPRDLCQHKSGEPGLEDEFCYFETLETVWTVWKKIWLSPRRHTATRVYFTSVWIK